MLVTHKLHIKKQLEKLLKLKVNMLRQSGGNGQYGHAVIEMEPTEGRDMNL